jgi:hypothetical protein
MVDAADDAWLMALILSTTSLGIVMPMLKERGLTTKPYGQALLTSFERRGLHWVSKMLDRTPKQQWNRPAVECGHSLS